MDKARVWIMVFNTTFNNISAISWRSVLLVKETGVPRVNHQPAAMLHRVDLAMNGISSGASCMLYYVKPRQIFIKSNFILLFSVLSSPPP
jgi:hypothetical protein